MSDVDEQLLELICDDPELLRDEFFTIVALEWPGPPCNRVHTATDAPRWDGRNDGIYPARVGPSSRPRHPGVGGWARERSPPERRTRQLVPREVIATRTRTKHPR
jgi:hypothetical protein